MQNNEWQKYICLIFMTIAAHCNWMLIARKLTRGPSWAELHPTQRSPKSVRASSRPIFPRRQLPRTRGQLLIFSVLLLSAPQCCTLFQTWKLVPPFFGEKAATPNEGWHSSSLLLILLLLQLLLLLLLLLQLPSSHRGLRPRVSVCSQTQQPSHFLFRIFSAPMTNICPQCQFGSSCRMAIT